jgi:hypothetical protein
VAIQVALGYGNTGGLANLTPEPRLEGIAQGRALIAGNRLMRYDGTMRAELIWGFALISSLSTYWDDFVYNNILTQLGLASADSAEITIALPNNRTRTNVNHNGVAYLPDLPSVARWDRRKLSEFRITIQGIVAI